MPARSPLNRRSLGLAVVAGILAVAAAYLGWNYQQRQAPGVVSGSYSDDWMSQCGPLDPAAQKACSARLDALYGKSSSK